MQAVILAAGMGSRLGALTAGSTKCMIPLHGRRLIERLFDGLAGLGLRRAVLVVGHGAAEVRAALGDACRGLPIVYVYNRAYRTTNNIYSLALASGELCADDSLLIESDLVLDPQILRACAAGPSPAAAVARYQPWMEGTVTTLDSAGCISRFIPRGGYDPAAAEGYYKTVNLYRLGREFCVELFAPALHAHVAQVGPLVYYEEVLGRLVDQGRARIRAVIVDGLPWYEIDTAEDLRAAETLFAPGPREA